MATVADPSTPGRTVPKKKANAPFLKHQQELEKRAKDAAAAPSAKQQRGIVALLIKWAFVAALTAVGVGMFVTGDPIYGYRGKLVQKEFWFPPPQRVFSAAELSLYNGRDKSKPVYVSVKGEVYDVTLGRRIYGPGGPYDFFAGRDASRAYTTGCFKPAQGHLTHDVRGLTLVEHKAIEDWRQFFKNHPQYFKVGKLDFNDPAIKIDPKSKPPPPCDAPANAAPA